MKLAGLFFDPGLSPFFLRQQSLESFERTLWEDSCRTEPHILEFDLCFSHFRLGSLFRKPCRETSSHLNQWGGKPLTLFLKDTFSTTGEKPLPRLSFLQIHFRWGGFSPSLKLGFRNRPVLNVVFDSFRGFNEQGVCPMTFPHFRGCPQHIKDLESIRKMEKTCFQQDMKWLRREKTMKRSQMWMKGLNHPPPSRPPSLWVLSPP